MQSCFRLDNPVPTAAFTLSVWLAQGCPAMPSTACYYAANLGDNPCKLVTDTFIPVHGLQGLFFGFLFLVFGVFFILAFAAISASILLSCELWEEEKSVLSVLNLSPVRRWNKNFYLPFYHSSSFFFLLSPLVWCPERKEGVLGQESFTSLLSIHHSFSA